MIAAESRRSQGWMTGRGSDDGVEDTARSRPGNTTSRSRSGHITSRGGGHITSRGGYITSRRGQITSRSMLTSRCMSHPVGLQGYAGASHAVSRPLGPVDQLVPICVSFDAMCLDLQRKGQLCFSQKGRICSTRMVRGTQKWKRVSTSVRVSGLLDGDAVVGTTPIRSAL